MIRTVMGFLGPMLAGCPNLDAQLAANRLFKLRCEKARSLTCDMNLPSCIKAMKDYEQICYLEACNREASLVSFVFSKIIKPAAAGIGLVAFGLGITALVIGVAGLAHKSFCPEKKDVQPEKKPVDQKVILKKV